jgi:hypothetical protein
MGGTSSPGMLPPISTLQKLAYFGTESLLNLSHTLTNLQHFIEAGIRYGYWSGSREENAAIGITCLLPTILGRIGC